MTKETSKGITSYRDQYGWFTAAKPKKKIQNVSNENPNKQVSKNKQMWISKSPVPRNGKANDYKKINQSKKNTSNSSNLAKPLSKLKTKHSTVISKPFIVNSHGVVMNLQNKPLVRKPHLYSLNNSTNPKGPFKQWVPRKT